MSNSKNPKIANALGDDVFEKAHHSINMLHSLQNCHDTFVLNRESVDEKLFDEINSFERFIKHFEGVFLDVVMNDLKAISKAAVINPTNYEKAKELMEKIKNLLEDFNKMESKYIQKAENLKMTSNHLRAQLDSINKDMESKVNMGRKQKDELDAMITWNKHAN